ncbi:hypothetical protein EC988_004467 [Linderina pennispora]|nr:hypothetical protein EC988_004467 [Linderina pennispora]
MDVIASRLDTLERLVYSKAAGTAAATTNLAEQVAVVDRELKRTLADQPVLSAGLQKYDRLRGLIDGDGDLELQRKLLGINAKLEIILLNDGAAQILSDLRTIKDLEPKANMPEYKTAAEQLPKAKAVEAAHVEQAEQFRQAVAEVSALIDRYHAETGALSEMFVEWDRVLTGLEHKAAQLEAARSK